VLVCLYADSSFRRALAELSGADLHKVQQFEKFLLAVVTHRRWFTTFMETSDLRHVEDFLGLEIVKPE
jgi:hypothetical protein